MGEYGSQIKGQGVFALVFSQSHHEQIEAMKKNWEERIKRKELEEQKAKAEALKKAAEISLFLKEKYGADKIILFGSLAWRTKFSSHSDIDLCVVGFPEKVSYWEALAEAEKMAAPFPLNLVLKENINPRLAAKIEKEGVILNGNKQTY